MRYAGHRRSETNPLASIPLVRPASVLKPFEPLPNAAPAAFQDPRTAPSDDELRRRELANAEAALIIAMNCLSAARAEIREANRTHTAPIVSNGHVVMAARPFTAQRMRERRSYAFRLFNKRCGEVAAARRRVDAARLASDLPLLAVIEERAATKAVVRVSKQKPAVAETV